MPEIQTLTIALSWPVDDDALARYQSYVSPQCKILSPKSREMDDLAEVARDADVIVGGYVPAGMIKRANRLRMVQVTHAGAVAADALEPDLDQAYLGFPLSMLKERGILMGNIHGNRILVAEHAIALMMTLAKQVFPAHRAIARGGWLPFTPENRSITIQGSTVAIVGLGAIGQEVAIRLKPFGPRILAIKRTPSPALRGKLGLDFVGGREDLIDVLGQADFVLLTLPLTRETHHIIGEAELAAMKRTTYLVNVARGQLVEERAVHRALVERRIAGFASDVWWFYNCRPKPGENFVDIGYFCPVPSRLGVHQLDNVIVTADRSCFTNTMEEDYMKDALENVNMLAEDKRPHNLVDLDQLY
jgi:phosphoglycerate dehydrogenase-like enzyme